MKYNKNADKNITYIGTDFSKGPKLSFLLAKKIPKVKCNNIITDAIDPPIANPFEPYAKIASGNPIFPQLGKIKGPNSVIESLLINFSTIIPGIAKRLTNKKVIPPNFIKVLKSKEVETSE